ncbi:MAG: BlaI/MecI/CopY family transcriptional regulator [Clostridiaceae bacterium]|jgi:BlaI family penicillinase repressor|nr:BlaI/MecI/CopY family transcriptional regulator [Clostridiaceae bacterium]
MKNVPGISNTEWLVMKVIWNLGECPASRIIEELAESTEWKPKTVKSLLSRLLKKKAIGYREENRTYIYYPLVTEEQCIRAESQSFLDRVFGGQTNMAIANFIQNSRMSKQQIDELRKLLDEKKE